MGKIFWFDTETTGLNPAIHGITELSALIEIDGNIVEELTYYIKPHDKAEIDTTAIEVQGKTLDEIYQRGENERTVYLNLKKKLAKYVNKFNKTDKFVQAGYNTNFDDGFLRELFARNNDKYYGSWFINARIDVLTLVAIACSIHKYPVNNFKLTTISNYYEIPLNAHRTLDDIVATRTLYNILIKEIKDGCPH